MTELKIRCPKCFAVASQRVTAYGIRYAHCGLWAWDRGPLVDAETHQLRQRAHELFDPTWKSGALTRKAAYSQLAQRLDIPLSKCHIKLFNKERLQQVIGLLEAVP